jgi:uncharacterized protein YndB with AHSA1/START domain
MTDVSGEVAEEQVEVHIEVGASAEVAFDYFVDPAMLSRWLGRALTIDPVPGGAFSVAVDDGTTGEEFGFAVGSYTEIDRPKRLVLSWGWDGSDEVPPGSSSVEVSFDDRGASTVISITHAGLPADFRETHLEGWLEHGIRLTEDTAGDTDS